MIESSLDEVLKGVHLNIDTQAEMDKSAVSYVKQAILDNCENLFGILEKYSYEKSELPAEIYKLTTDLIDEITQRSLTGASPISHFKESNEPYIQLVKLNWSKFRLVGDTKDFSFTEPSPNFLVHSPEILKMIDKYGDIQGLNSLKDSRFSFPSE